MKEKIEPYEYDFDEEVFDYTDSEPVKDEIVFNAKSSEPISSSSEVVLNRAKKKGSFSYDFKERKISEAKRKELEEIYSRVVVNDYGDDYHLSEEERKRKSKYYQQFTKLRKCKRKYKKIEEFVKTYRLAMECLDMVAKDNGVYDPVKFKRMVIKGKIKVFGLEFPKYNGKDRKDISWNFISKCIMDPENYHVEDLHPENHPDTEKMAESTEERFIRLFGEDPATVLARDEAEKNPEDDIVRYRDPNGDDEGYAFVASDKNTKKFIKQCPEIVKVVRDHIRETEIMKNRNGRLGSSIYTMDEDDFDAIYAIDSSRGFKSSSDIPEFQGDAMNEEDVKRFEYQLHIFEVENVRRHYDGKMRTEEEINIIELKNAFEEGGINVRALYKQKDKEKKLKKALKKDKKREEKLKQQLLDTQDRIKKRKKKNYDVEFDAKKKKKDKKKKKKKNKESD